MAKSSLLLQIVNASVKAEQEFKRSQAAQVRANSRYAAVMDREEKRAWLEEMQDEADSRTEDLEQQLEDIDGILEASLDHDDFYDLEQLRRHVKHPEFNSPHQAPLEPVRMELLPNEPIYKDPVWGRILPRTARESTNLRALEKFKAKHSKWQEKYNEILDKNSEESANWAMREKVRLEKLRKDEEKYKDKCLQAEIEIQKANSELDQVIRGLPLGDQNAVETYTHLVLAESEYPDDLHPGTDLSFDPVTRELNLNIKVAEPKTIPRVSSYRFQKSSGEILERPQTQKDVRERYQRFVCNVVLRTIHEVLEADRTHVVHLVSVSASVRHISPGTGQETETVILNVSTSREEFVRLDLRRVVPFAALEGMGASMSKNMVSLTPASKAKSVRKS